MYKNLSRWCAAAAAAALLLSTPSMALPLPVAAQQQATVAVPAPETGASLERASDVDLEAAQGGLYWVVVGYAASVSSIAIRTCASRVDSCARGAMFIATSAKAARKYVCNRWRRLC
ncbi:MAG TPA: hypothetical protein VGC35_05895 [Allosphingosinicella sp.]